MLGTTTFSSVNLSSSSIPVWLFLINNFSKAFDFSPLITQSSKNIKPPIRTSFFGGI